MHKDVWCEQRAATALLKREPELHTDLRLHWPSSSESIESLNANMFDSRTPTGRHYFGIIYCLNEQHELQTASSHVRAFLSNTSPHAHWLQCRNSDFRLMSVNQKRLRLCCLLGDDHAPPTFAFTEWLPPEKEAARPATHLVLLSSAASTLLRSISSSASSRLLSCLSVVSWDSKVLMRVFNSSACSVAALSFSWAKARATWASSDK